VREPIAHPLTKHAPPVTTGPKKSQAEVENSLRSLVGPPSSLHTQPEAAAVPPSPEANSRLTKSDAINLADAEARRRGLDPAGFKRAEPQYSARDETWTLSYDQPAPAGSEEPGQRFSVTIDDKTKGTVFVPGK
jgi:hypothetical protein